MSEALYNRDILRLAVSIPHQERLLNPDGSAECRSKTCGSRVVADIKLTGRGYIADLGLEVNACALGQASTSILGAEAVGKPRSEIDKARIQLSSFLNGDSNKIGTWENMEMLKSVKEHKGRHAAVLLPYDAILSAIDDALSKAGVA